MLWFALQHPQSPPWLQWGTADIVLYLLSPVDLVPKAVEQGVAFVPGSAFYAGNADPRSIRMSFVTASVEQINIGIKALTDAIKAL